MVDTWTVYTRIYKYTLSRLILDIQLIKTNNKNCLSYANCKHISSNVNKDILLGKELGVRCVATWTIKYEEINQ